MANCFYVLNVGLCFERAQTKEKRMSATSFYVLNVGLCFERKHMWLPGWGFYVLNIGLCFEHEYRNNHNIRVSMSWISDLFFILLWYCCLIGKIDMSVVSVSMCNPVHLSACHAALLRTTCCRIQVCIRQCFVTMKTVPQYKIVRVSDLGRP